MNTTSKSMRLNPAAGNTRQAAKSAKAHAAAVLPRGSLPQELRMHIESIVIRNCR